MTQNNQVSPRQTLNVGTATPRSAQKVAALDKGFTVTPSPDGKASRFAISGSGIGIGAWVAFAFASVIAGGFAVLFIGIASSNSRGFVFPPLPAFLLTIAIVLGCAFLWNRLRKKQFTFEITDDGVHAPDGQHYAKDNISEILIRNQGAIAYSASVQSTMVMGGTGITGMAMAGAAAVGNVSNAVGNAIGDAVRQSIAKRGYEVCFRYGRKVIPLAKYLRENDAIALFNKVQEVL